MTAARSLNHPWRKKKTPLIHFFPLSRGENKPPNKPYGWLPPPGAAIAREDGDPSRWPIRPMKVSSVLSHAQAFATSTSPSNLKPRA